MYLSFLQIELFSLFNLKAKLHSSLVLVTSHKFSNHSIVSYYCYEDGSELQIAPKLNRFVCDIFKYIGTKVI